MKKQILLALFAAVSSITFAQVTPTFGIRAGVTSSGMRGQATNSFNNLVDLTNGMVTTSNRTGFFAGGYVSIPVTPAISIEPAIYYSQKGYDLNGSLNIKGAEFLGVNAKASIVSNYIDVPILVKANMSGFQVFAGPQVSYLANASFKTSAGLLGLNLVNYKTDMTSQLAKLDAAVTAGIGYQLSNGFNITASYDYGLLKADAGRSVKSYNQGFKVGVGIGF